MDPTDLLKESLKGFSYATSTISGIGGILKKTPDDFCVRETMPYKPNGAGEHVYVTLTRRNLTTPQVGKILAKLFNVPIRDVGWAGMKDKVATSTQTFSMRMGVHADLDEVQRTIAKNTDFIIIETNKHRNKIKRGHVTSNEFVIRLRNCTGDFATAIKIRNEIIKQGIPNYYGMQRFGRTLSNVSQAYVALGDDGLSQKNRFSINVLQSALFNAWLTDRMHDGIYKTLILGDVAQKKESGGLFIVKELKRERERFAAGEISYTGPMFGYDFMNAEEEAGERERDTLKRFGIDPVSFKKNRAKGTRRAATVDIQSIELTNEGDGNVKFEFSLPAGSYATIALREFSKNEIWRSSTLANPTNNKKNALASQPITTDRKA